MELSISCIIISSNSFIEEILYSFLIQLKIVRYLMILLMLSVILVFDIYKKN